MKKILLAAAFGIACLLPPAAYGHGVVDQTYPVAPATTDSTAHVSPSFTWTQSFTAGISGFMDHIALPLTYGQATPTANLTIGIYAASGDSPTGSALATATVTPAQVSSTAGCPAAYVSIQVLPAVTIVSGTKYVIQASTGAGGTYFWCGTAAAGYAGGRSLANGSTVTGANIPDLGFTTYVAATATPVTFRGASAARTAKGVVVRWRTASEIDMLGFNVYREVNGRRVKVNPRLVIAKGGGAYSFLDRKAPRASVVRYRIQVVNVDGSRTWYGPIVVRPLR